MLVIGPVSVHVSRAVDQPGAVEGDGVAEDGSQEVGIPQALSPDEPGHQRRHHKTHEHHGELIVPARQDVTSAMNGHLLTALGTAWVKHRNQQDEAQGGTVNLCTSQC